MEGTASPEVHWLWVFLSFQTWKVLAVVEEEACKRWWSEFAFLCTTNALLVLLHLFQLLTFIIFYNWTSGLSLHLISVPCINDHVIHMWIQSGYTHQEGTDFMILCFALMNLLGRWLFCTPKMVLTINAMQFLHFHYCGHLPKVMLPLPFFYL